MKLTTQLYLVLQIRQTSYTYSVLYSFTITCFILASWQNRCHAGNIFGMCAVLYSIQQLIQQIALVTINNHLLFCDARTTCFGLYRPSSGRPFTNEYVYNKCYQICAYMEFKYNVIHLNISKM